MNRKEIIMIMIGQLATFIKNEYILKEITIILRKDWPTNSDTNHI